MRILFLALFFCLWSISQAPVVLAGTRAFVEKPPPSEDTLCRGSDGNWYPLGARECLPRETVDQPPAAEELADTQEKTDATQASEGSGSRDELLLLAAILAAILLAAAAIMGASRLSRRASAPAANTATQSPEPAPRAQPDQPEMTSPVPLPLPVGEDLSESATPREPHGMDDEPVPADGRADLVVVWTGGPYTIEFTSKDEDDYWHRNTVDITGIMRDPLDGGWHLHGFCHLWREERDYDGASITTKILYKRRRWDLEDWITEIAGEDACSS